MVLSLYTIVIYNSSFQEILHYSFFTFHYSLKWIYFFKVSLQGDHKQPYLSSFSRPTSLAGIGEKMKLRLLKKIKIEKREAETASLSDNQNNKINF